MILSIIDIASQLITDDDYEGCAHLRAVGSKLWLATVCAGETETDMHQCQMLVCIGSDPLACGWWSITGVPPPVRASERGSRLGHDLRTAVLVDAPRHRGSGDVDASTSAT